MKKLSFSRVVTLQGCRQAGKSFLARELFPPTSPKAKYLSFDQRSVKTFAENNPESFLEKHRESHPLILDEAQKVPEIFDAIKYQVDQHPEPGQYFLLGSTEFSKLVKVRESLTGRMSRVRLFPLTLGESLELQPTGQTKPLHHLLQKEVQITRTQLLKHFERGGFPGIFAVRDDGSRKDFFTDWTRLTVDRDLNQFTGIQVDPELALQVLERVAALPEPGAAHIAKALRKDTRSIQKILNLLETLFVVHKLMPFRAGTGKPLYFLCDVGLAHHLGADFERQLWTWLLHEQLAQRTFLNNEDWRIAYYRNTKGRIIHFIAENVRSREVCGLKLLHTEKMDLREFEILWAFEKKVRSEFKMIHLSALGPSPLGTIQAPHSDHPLTAEVFQWESLV